MTNSISLQSVLKNIDEDFAEEIRSSLGNKVYIVDFFYPVGWLTHLVVGGYEPVNEKNVSGLITVTLSVIPGNAIINRFNGSKFHNINGIYQSANILHDSRFNGGDPSQIHNYEPDGFLREKFMDSFKNVNCGDEFKYRKKFKKLDIDKIEEVIYNCKHIKSIREAV